MGTRLYFDLRKSAGQRYWSALTAVPGIVTPGVATLSIVGQQPAAAQPQTVFRTPVTALLTLTGLQLASPGQLTPGVGALNYQGKLPVLTTVRLIIPAVPQPSEVPEQSSVPTLITIMTMSPAAAQLQIQVLPQNVTQGGNIGFVSPTPAHISLGGLQAGFLFQAPPPAPLQIIGYAPMLTLRASLSISPDSALLVCAGFAPALNLPFNWVDDEPAPQSLWIDDAAA